jgi:hypothetical protein
LSSQDDYNKIVEIEGEENINTFQESVLSQPSKFVYDILDIESEV